MDAQVWVLMTRHTRKAEMLTLLWFPTAEAAIAHAEGIMGKGRAGYSVVGLKKAENLAHYQGE